MRCRRFVRIDCGEQSREFHAADCGRAAVFPLAMSPEIYLFVHLMLGLCSLSISGFLYLVEAVDRGLEDVEEGAPLGSIA